MTRKLKLIVAAGVLALAGAGAELAVAQTSPRTSAVEGSKATSDNVARIAVASVSRPADATMLPGRPTTVVGLSKQECTDMGGVVGQPAKDMTCSKGWACYTASAGGAIKGQCITE